MGKAAGLHANLTACQRNGWTKACRFLHVFEKPKKSLKSRPVTMAVANSLGEAKKGVMMVLENGSDSYSDDIEAYWFLK